MGGHDMIVLAPFVDGAYHSIRGHDRMFQPLDEPLHPAASERHDVTQFTISSWTSSWWRRLKQKAECRSCTIGVKFNASADETEELFSEKRWERISSNQFPVEVFCRVERQPLLLANHAVERAVAKTLQTFGGMLAADIANLDQGKNI